LGDWIPRYRVQRGDGGLAKNGTAAQRAILLRTEVVVFPSYSTPDTYT
jgi:hypothetical protein